MTVRERLHSVPYRRHGVASALAVALFVLAYDDGGFALQTQATIAVIVWWAILLSLFVALAGVERLGVVGGWVAAALAGFTAWTLASAFWSTSPEAAISASDLTVLYLGIFLFVGLIARPASSGSWADGLAFAISAVAFVALASRLFPTLFSPRGLTTFLPYAETRLSFPLGYWNGLGIFCALAVPLLLRSSLVAGSSLRRGLALVPVPVVVADIYLASSRGAVATLLVGTIVLLVASTRRSALVAAIIVAAAGSAVTILVLLRRHALVDGPLASPVAHSEGRSAVWLIAIACLATASAYTLGCRYWPSRLVPTAAFGRVASLSAVVLTAVLIVAAHPVRRFDAFKQISGSYQSGDLVQAHLLSGSGSGRWAFWISALDEWKTAPWMGRGAGSFAAWWLSHASFSYFITDAHSLYLQTLGELGVIGLALLLATFLGGVSVGIVRLKRTDGDTRVTNAALLSVLVAYLVAAGVDWMWQLPIVTIVAFICLALLVGAATSSPTRTVRDDRRRRSRSGLAAAAIVSAVAVLAIVGEADQLEAQTKIAASQSATAGNQLSVAFTDAVDARDLEPWAATPYLQIALVAEEQGDLVTAGQAIATAIHRAPNNWDLWLIGARIDIKRGMISRGLTALNSARRLNPTSPLFASSS